jgi:hypothetical protein
MMKRRPNERVIFKCGSDVMSEQIKNIFERLEQIREDLLSLSDDIWLSIDHNDAEALEQGVAFKKEYNAKVAAFDRLGEDLSILVQQFTANKLDSKPPVIAPVIVPNNSQIINDLKQHHTIALDDDWTFKRPYGVAIGSKAQNKLNTWRRLFEFVCHYLAHKNPDLFLTLPDHPKFKTRRGTVGFSRIPQELRISSALSFGIYVEVNASANQFRDYLKILFEIFNLESSELRIYLRSM